MKQKIIKVGVYIFVLSINEDNEIVTSHFLLDKYSERDMSQEELNKGRKIQKQIFNGEYDHLIPDTINVGGEVVSQEIKKSVI